MSMLVLLLLARSAAAALTVIAFALWVGAAKPAFMAHLLSRTFDESQRNDETCRRLRRAGIVAALLVGGTAIATVSLEHQIFHSAG